MTFDNNSLTLRLHPCFEDARVLITGGAGFIGSHLTKSLLHMGAHVTVVDGKAPVVPEFRRGSLTPVPARVGTDEFARWLPAAGPFDYIFHLAGRADVGKSVTSPHVDFSTNLLATMHLLEALRVLDWKTRLVFASSAAVYGNPACLPVDEATPTIPISPYGVGKLAAERYVAVYSRLYGLSAATLRMFSVYGPGQTKLVIYDFMAKLHASPGELVVHGDGTQVRDFLYVEDAVRAFLVVAAWGRDDGFAYNAASGQGIAIGDLAQFIVRAQEPGAAITFTQRPRQGDPDRWIGSCVPLTDLGWQPLCSLDSGIARTAAWFGTLVGRQTARQEALTG